VEIFSFLIGEKQEMEKVVLLPWRRIILSIASWEEMRIVSLLFNKGKEFQIK
jgi:hypothetical protein